MSFNVSHSMRLQHIGSLAKEILSVDQEIQVMGKSSQGIFIRTSGRWMVFLSFERFRGPLTLTLASKDQIFEEIGSSEQAAIHSEKIFFPAKKVLIDCQGCNVWEPPEPAAEMLDEAEKHRMSAAVEHDILVKKEGSGLGAIVSKMFVPERNLPSFGHDLPAKLAVYKQIQKVMRENEFVQLAEMLSSSMGMGQGLTPAWDDFIIGLTLCLNRYQDSTLSRENLEVFNQRIVEAAYRRTTTLSANLIECAALGLADERLIDVLDLMVSGFARNNNVVDFLLTWGHSSAVEAFYGMVIGLTAQDMRLQDNL